MFLAANRRDLISMIFRCFVGQKVFEWDQTLEEVNMYIKLPPNVHPKAFHCKIQSKHIEVGIKGNPPFLNVSSFFTHLSTFWIRFSLSLSLTNLRVLVKSVNFQHDLSAPVKTDCSFWTLGTPFCFCFLASLYLMVRFIFLDEL